MEHLLPGNTISVVGDVISQDFHQKTIVLQVKDEDKLVVMQHNHAEFVAFNEADSQMACPAFPAGVAFRVVKPCAVGCPTLENSRGLLTANFYARRFRKATDVEIGVFLENYKDYLKEKAEKEEAATAEKKKAEEQKKKKAEEQKKKEAEEQKNKEVESVLKNISSMSLAQLTQVMDATRLRCETLCTESDTTK